MESVQQWLVLIGEMTREWMPIVSILLIYLILRRLGKTKKNLTVKLTEPATESEIKDVNRKINTCIDQVDKLYKEHAALRKSKEGVLSAMSAIRNDARDSDKFFRKELEKCKKYVDNKFLAKSEVVPFMDRLDTIMREIIPLLFFHLNIDYSGEKSQKPSHVDRLNRFVYPKNSIWAVSFQEFQKRSSEWSGENTIAARLEFVQKCLQDLGLEMDGVPSRVDTLEEETGSVFAQVDENEAMLKVIRKLPTVEPLLPAHLRVEADLKPTFPTGQDKAIAIAKERAQPESVEDKPAVFQLADKQSIGDTVGDLKNIMLGADQDLIPEMCPGCDNTKSGRIRLVGRYEGQVVGDHTAYMWECGDCNHVFAFTAGITTQQQEEIDKELGKEGIANAIVPPRIGDKFFGTMVNALRAYTEVDQSLVPKLCSRCGQSNEHNIRLVKEYDHDPDLHPEFTAYLWACKSCKCNFVFPKWTPEIETASEEGDKTDTLRDELWPGYADRSVKFIQEHARREHLPLIPDWCPHCNSCKLLHITLCGEQNEECSKLKQHDWRCGLCDALFIHPYPNKPKQPEPEPDTRKAIRQIDSRYMGCSAAYIADQTDDKSYIPMTCPNCKHGGVKGAHIALSYAQDREETCRGNWWHCGSCTKDFAYPYEKQTQNIGRKLKGDDRGHSASWLILQGVATKFIPEHCPGCNNFRQEGKGMCLVTDQDFISSPPTTWKCGKCSRIFVHPQPEEKTLQPEHKGCSMEYITADGVDSKFIPSRCPSCVPRKGDTGITLVHQRNVSENRSRWHCRHCDCHFTHEHK